MRVAVIGAGVAGCATACELALAGHTVHLLERSGSVAAEASFAPTGAITPALLAGFGPMALAACAQVAPAASLLDMLRPGRARWAVAARRRHAGAARHAQQLAQESLARLHGLTTQHGVDLQGAVRPADLMVLFAHARLRARAIKTVARLQSGIDAPWPTPDTLDAAATTVLEPGLATAALRGGAWHLPAQGLATAHTLAHALKDEARRLGAAVTFGAAVSRIEPGTPWRVDGEPFDAVVLCTGALPPAGKELARLHRLPLRQRWGMSLTAPLQSVDHNLEQGPTSGPRGLVVDAEDGVLITPLGERLRAAVDCGWQAGGEATARRLYRSVEAWFPGAARSSRVKTWSHAAALTPDGLPLTGPVPGQTGLWLHLGLGLHGAAWAVAGAARLVRQMDGGAPDALDAALSPRRFGQ